MSERRKYPPLNEAVPGDLPQESVGWSPYEVWRTQILLPRLEEERRKQADGLVANEEQENHIAGSSTRSIAAKVLARTSRLFA